MYLYNIIVIIIYYLYYYIVVFFISKNKESICKMLLFYTILLLLKLDNNNDYHSIEVKDYLVQRTNTTNLNYQYITAINYMSFYTKLFH